MNKPNAPHAEVDHKPSMHLLDTIRAIRAGVGDGLNDHELTRLLRQTLLPGEAGFGFLSYSDGFATLTVPHQDPAKWYSEKGWIAEEKERIARGIAEKHQLSVSEPPDETTSSLFPPSEPTNTRHHLELTNRWETVVVAHPYYLKIRLFGATSVILYARLARSPLQFSPSYCRTFQPCIERDDRHRSHAFHSSHLLTHDLI